MDKITVDSWKNVICDVDDSTVIYLGVGDDAIEVSVKKSLSIEEKLAFVNDVVEGCFNNGAYIHPLFEFTFNACVIAHYTNIDMDVDTADMDALIRGTDIMSQLYEEVPELLDVYDMCRDTCDRKANALNEVCVELINLINNMGALSDLLGADGLRVKDKNGDK